MRDNKSNLVTYISNSGSFYFKKFAEIFILQNILHFAS